MVPYLRAANVKDGRLDLSDVKEMNFSPSEQAGFALRDGDILVTEGSGSLSAVGSSAIWLNELEGPVCFQNTLLRLRPRAGTDPRFLAWWCRYAHADGLFASVATGANIQHLGADRIRALPMAGLSMGQQRAIADFLDTETARIDALIDKRLRSAELLQEKSAAIIAQAFGRGLIWTPASIPVGCEGLPSAPLYTMAEVRSGLAKNAADEDPSAPAWPYLRVANVQDGYVALDEIKELRLPGSLAQRFLLRPGDVLMTEGGDPDKLGRGVTWNGQIQPCLHQNHVFAVRPNPRRILPEYLALATRSSYARVYFEVTSKKTTGIASTNASTIANWRVPMRDLAQQKEVVGVTSDKLAEVDDLDRAITRQVELLREHRQALITAAVTGELEVPGAAA